MNRFIRVASCVLFTMFAVGSSAQGWADQPDETKRHKEADGKFSFIPPKGWTIEKKPGLKFKVAVDASAAQFPSNIVVVDGSYEGSLADYVKANVVGLQQTSKNGRLVKQEDFKTSSGLEGGRVIFEREVGDKLHRHTFYFFSRGKTKFVVTCTTLAEGGEKFDPIFETSLKTFRFEEK